MVKRIRDTTPDIIAAARCLRLRPTPAERILWNALKNRQLDNLRFRFQHPIDSFIVDFYCPERRLMIELDGEIHVQQVEYDQVRTERLEQLGYRVIRFRNSDVIDHLSEVLEKIQLAAQ